MIALKILIFLHVPETCFLHMQESFTDIRMCYITLRNSSPVVVFLCLTENAITVIHTIRLSTISRAAVVPRVTPSVRCDVGQEASAEERKLHDIRTPEQTLQKFKHTSMVVLNVYTY